MITNLSSLIDVLLEPFNDWVRGGRALFPPGSVPSPVFVAGEVPSSMGEGLQKPVIGGGLPAPGIPISKITLGAPSGRGIAAPSSLGEHLTTTSMGQPSTPPPAPQRPNLPSTALGEPGTIGPAPPPVPPAPPATPTSEQVRATGFVPGATVYSYAHNRTTGEVDFENVGADSSGMAGTTVNPQIYDWVRFTQPAGYEYTFRGYYNVPYKSVLVNT